MHCGLATICVFPFAEHVCFTSFPFTLCSDMVLRPWSQYHNLWSWSWSWPLTAPRQNLSVHRLFHQSRVRNGRVHPVLLMKLAVLSHQPDQDTSLSAACLCHQLHWCGGVWVISELGPNEQQTCTTVSTLWEIFCVLPCRSQMRVFSRGGLFKDFIVRSRVAELYAISIFAV